MIAREVTKLHEEFLRGRAEDVLAQLEAARRGAGRDHTAHRQGRRGFPAVQSTKTVAQRVKELVQEEKLEEKGALKQAAKEFGLSKSEAYRELQRAKYVVSI